MKNALTIAAALLLASCSVDRMHECAKYRAGLLEETKEDTAQRLRLGVKKISFNSLDAYCEIMTGYKW